MEPWIGPRVGIVIDVNDEPRIILQRVPEPRNDKNRLHIDIHVDDIEGEAVRILGLGARRIDTIPIVEVGSRWIRMLDPEGNEFCIVEARG